MNAPVILTTTTPKNTLESRLAYRKLTGKHDSQYTRVMLDAYDILRVIELPTDKDSLDTTPICEVSYDLENEVKVKDGKEEETQVRDVSRIKVRHSLDEIFQMMKDAKDDDKEDWQL